MIILRKVNTSTTASTNSVYVAGDLLGVKNSSNQVYTTEYDYTPDRITIYYNGQALHSPYDFSQSGDNEITFVSITPTSDDVLKTTYQTDSTEYTDIDLIYNSGVWESTSSSYTEIPRDTKVYVNGIKQETAYYQLVLNSGKLEVSFGFYTSDEDWVNIEAPMLDDQDLTYNAGTWITSLGYYSAISTVLQVYFNGVKQDDTYTTTTVSGGDFEITFDFPTEDTDWVNIDIPTDNFLQGQQWYDIDMVYSSGAWRTPTSVYTEIPSEIRVFLNGVKQKSNSYVVSISSSKIQVNLEKPTSDTDWVNIIILR